MGDLQLCSFLRQNGDVLRREDRLCLGLGQTSVTSSWDPGSISEKNWEFAEEGTREIVNRIHPSVVADCKRKEVIGYVQGLINSSLGFQVFPYGSVPLKTYLPDGDIDLTVISNPTIEDTAVSDVCAVLKAEEQNEDALFEVKDVHYIDAEVKLIKCIVQNIVVDISFNQLGGLSTLCFLEQIDWLVGKNRLFKRSIILIKAWCYYESRILGSHHGLISTYALETLILYIFNLFHSSLNGPLAVLYRFLDYLSKFDWENYCISLNGPVCKSSLPDIVAKPPENGRDELLLSDEFLRKCAGMFSVPSRRLEKNSQIFPQKHLNIIDPLKLNNNLGRSVNRGNFYRIRSAFRYGAQKLGRILLLPNEEITNELNKFFGNTLDRHGNNYWTGVQNSKSPSGSGSFDDLSSSLWSSHSNAFSDENIYLKSKDDGSIGTSCSGKCGKIKDGIYYRETLANFTSDNEMNCSSRLEPKESNLSSSFCSSSNGSGISTPDNVAGNLDTNLGERVTSGISGHTQSLKPLLDPTVDYDSHLRSATYGHSCHLFAVSAPLQSCSLVLPQSQNKSPRTVYQSLQLKRNVQPRINANGNLRPQIFLVNPVTSFSAAFSSEEKKIRGTGTYIPNMSYHSNRDWLSSGRGSNQAQGAHGQLHRHVDDNGLSTTPQMMNSSECSQGLSETEYPCLGKGRPPSSEAYQSHHPSVWGPSKGPTSARPSEKFGSRNREGYLPERILAADTGSSCTKVSASSHVVTEPVSGNEQQRFALKSFHLKDEVDFPPLTH